MEPLVGESETGRQLPHTFVIREKTAPCDLKNIYLYALPTAMSRNIAVFLSPIICHLICNIQLAIPIPPVRHHLYCIIELIFFLCKIIILKNCIWKKVKHFFVCFSTPMPANFPRSRPTTSFLHVSIPADLIFFRDVLESGFWCSSSHIYIFYAVYIFLSLLFLIPPSFSPVFLLL